MNKTTFDDDNLTLYYYDDGLAADDRRAISDALNKDVNLAARYDALRRVLDGLAEDAPSPAPAVAVARWHDSIDRAQGRRRTIAAMPARRIHMPSFFWGGAVTAALAIGIGIGVLTSGGPAGSPPASGDATPGSAAAELQPARSRGAFSRSLQVHLRDSRRHIASLPVDPDADRMLLIKHIIEQNRLFERVADQSDSRDLARVLRAFEPVLLQLAAEGIAPREAEALRSQLEFEINVVLTKLHRERSEQSESI